MKTFKKVVAAWNGEEGMKSVELLKKDGAYFKADGNPIGKGTAYDLHRNLNKYAEKIGMQKVVKELDLHGAISRREFEVLERYGFLSETKDEISIQSLHKVTVVIDFMMDENKEIVGCELKEISDSDDEDDDEDDEDDDEDDEDDDEEEDKCCKKCVGCEFFDDCMAEEDDEDDDEDDDEGNVVSDDDELLMFERAVINNVGPKDLVAFIKVVSNCYNEEHKEHKNAPLEKLTDFVAKNWEEVKNLPVEVILRCFHLMRS